MMNCYVCDATPSDMAKRHCPKFKNIRRSTLQYGIGALHVRSRFFDNVVKFALNQDFKKRAIGQSKFQYSNYIINCTKNNILIFSSGSKSQRAKLKDLRTKRMTQFKRRFRRAFGIQPFEPLPSGYVFCYMVQNWKNSAICCCCLVKDTISISF